MSSLRSTGEKTTPVPNSRLFGDQEPVFGKIDSYRFDVDHFNRTGEIRKLKEGEPVRDARTVLPKEKFQSLLNENMTLLDIAIAVGLKRPTVYKLAKEYELNTRPEPPNTSQGAADHEENNSPFKVFEPGIDDARPVPGAVLTSEEEANVLSEFNKPDPVPEKTEQPAVPKEIYAIVVPWGDNPKEFDTWDQVESYIAENVPPAKISCIRIWREIRIEYDFQIRKGA